ncbi:MAG TPA: transcriptional regulator [Vicinamibacterales bacterium]
MPRYRFSQFVLSPRRRVLLRDGGEQPLIPRYFDLLVFLVQHRHEAVHRRDIFDKVWSDVVVSDSALSQAIRTIRRTLGDDSRDPRFISTVSRHGYRFVFADVTEEEDGAEWLPATTPAAPTAPPTEPDAFEPLLQRVTSLPTTTLDEDQQREAAELLHAFGTTEALRRLGTRPGHARARAVLRDTRWESPGAGPVPIVGAPAPVATAWALVTSRARRTVRVMGTRCAGAAIGAGLTGAIGGAAGGLMLAVAPSSGAPLAVVPVLAVIGGGCATAGGLGVAAGLSVAESVARSRRTLALVGGAALGGGLVGLGAQWLSRWGLAALVGLDVPIGGGVDGVALGAAAGLGYAVATGAALGGLATPRGRERLKAAAVVSLACGLAALALTLAGRPLVGGTVHAIAEASQGSQVLLTPLARLIGEPDFGPVSSAVLGTSEGALFGLGLALGLTRRFRA